jgi:hypothetical protein
MFIYHHQDDRAFGETDIFSQALDCVVAVLSSMSFGMAPKVFDMIEFAMELRIEHGSVQVARCCFDSLLDLTDLGHEIGLQ